MFNPFNKSLHLYSLEIEIIYNFHVDLLRSYNNFIKYIFVEIICFMYLTFQESPYIFQKSD